MYYPEGAVKPASNVVRNSQFGFGKFLFEFFANFNGIV